MAYILIANTTDKPKSVNCIIHPARIHYPLKRIQAALISGNSAKLDPAILTQNGQTVTIPADDVIMLEIKGI